MPNWCQNRLIVSITEQGAPVDLKEFYEKAQKPEELAYNSSGESAVYKKFRILSLAALFPEPSVEDHDWYDWRIDNWGTKWDVNAEIKSQESHQITYAFDSAWSPPSEWLKYIYTAFPKLHFELIFAECGNGFAGRSVASIEEEFYTVYEEEDDLESFIEENDFDNYF